MRFSLLMYWFYRSLHRTPLILILTVAGCEGAGTMVSVAAGCSGSSVSIAAGSAFEVTSVSIATWSAFEACSVTFATWSVFAAGTCLTLYISFGLGRENTH